MEFPQIRESVDISQYDLTEIETDVWYLVECIQDPEYPYTLGQLGVVDPSHVKVVEPESTICVHFCPTVRHCSMATMIGLSIVLKLSEYYGRTHHLQVGIVANSHEDDLSISKQLGDKERVFAAFENPDIFHLLLGLVGL